MSHETSLFNAVESRSEFTDFFANAMCGRRDASLLLFAIYALRVLQGWFGALLLGISTSLLTVMVKATGVVPMVVWWWITTIGLGLFLWLCVLGTGLLLGTILQMPAMFLHPRSHGTANLGNVIQRLCTFACALVGLSVSVRYLIAVWYFPAAEFVVANMYTPMPIAALKVNEFLCDIALSVGVLSPFIVVMVTFVYPRWAAETLDTTPPHSYM